MGRRKVIDRDSILDAAEAVVRRDGAAHLTLEAVAAEANISKASVLYDYKTKQALIRAVIERRVAAENDRMRRVMEKLGPVPDSAILSRIAAVARPMPASDRGVGMNLCAALARDADLRRPIQELYRERIAAVLETAERPRGALLAFLALEGLLALERLDIYVWPEEERRALLTEIRWLLRQEPERPNSELDPDSS